MGKPKPCFKEAHCREYGLEISSRLKSSGKIVAVVCLFCKYNGREHKAGMKRKRTEKTKIFKTFTVQCYKQHLNGQHTTEWDQYKLLSPEEKDAYFVQSGPPVTNTLHRHMDSEEPYVFTLNKPIVEVIIGEMMYDPDDEDVELSRARALSLFTLQEDAIEHDGEGDQSQESSNVDAYTTTIKSPTQFRLAIRFVACGSSFRMASRLIAETKDEMGSGTLVGCTEIKVAQYMRVVVAVNLQVICKLLQKTWVFSVALDVGNSAGTSYCDLRLRLYHNDDVVNVHFLALPMHARKTADNLFSMSSRALDVVCPPWRRKIVGVSTNGLYV